jgi:hypothetical protein
MYDGSRRVLAADLLKNQARKAAARNRKQISLERLKNKVDAQRARARDMHVGARKKHAKGLEPQSTQRQPALCTDESGEPIVGPMVLQRRAATAPIKLPHRPLARSPRMLGRS